MTSAGPREQLLYDRRLLNAEVRLLIISPSPDASHSLECQLRCVDMNTTPSFEALSYVWGDPEERAVFQCDGKHFSSTASLHRALVRIRPSDKPRAVWADAVCINQEDLDERAHQVTLMDRIYTQAQQVIVWLGNENEQSACTASTTLQLIFDACMAHEER